MSPRSTLSIVTVNMEQQQRSNPARIPSQSLPATNHNSPTHHTSQSQVPLLNLAVVQKQHALVKSKSMPGTSRELPAPTKFTFSSHDVSTMSKMTDNTSQIPHWREFPKPPIRILCRVELKAKLKLDTYKSTSHIQEYHHKSSSYPTKPISVFEPSPEQQYIQQYYEYDSHDDSDEEWDSDEDDEEDDDENFDYAYHAPSQHQPSSKHFTFPMQPQQPQQPSHQTYIPRTAYDYQKSIAMRQQQQPYPQQPQPQQQPQQRLSISNMEEKKRIIHRASMKSVPMKQIPLQQQQQQQQSNNQVVFTIHPQQHKYSQPDVKRSSFSQPQQHPQHQRSASHHQMEIRRNRSAPSIQSQTPPKHIIRTPSYEQQQQQQQQQNTNAYDLARNLWRKQRRSYQDMLSTLHSKLHISGSSSSYPPQFVSP